MAEVNFGILAQGLPQPPNIPSPIDAYNEAAKTDLTRAQTNLANTTSDVNKQELGIKKLDVMNKLAASVLYSPTQENLAAAKNMAKMAGIDTSSIPDDINQAMPIIKNAYYSSGQALQVAQAQAKLAMSAATLNLKSQENQISATKGASDSYKQGTPFVNSLLNLAGGASPSSVLPGAGIQGFPSVGVGLMPNVLRPQTQTNPAAAQAPALTNASPQIPASAQQSHSFSQYPELNNTTSNVMFPAEKKQQEEKAANWAELGKGVASGAASYPQIKNYLQNINNANESRSFGGAAGFLPEKLLENTPQGQVFKKETDNLYTEEMKSFGGLGLGKLDLPVYIAARGSLPDVNKYTSVNAPIIQQKMAQNEIRAKIAPYIFQTLDNAGVRDPVVFRNLLNQVVEKTGIYGDNGKVNISKLDTWEKHFRDILDQRQGTNPKSGTQVSYGDFYTAAKKANPTASDDQINQVWQSKYIANSQQSQDMQQQANANGSQQNAQASNQTAGNQQQVLQQVVPKLAESIGKFESNGNYAAIGNQTSSGDRAYGKYQVMGANIPTWTREVLGRPMSPKEFLQNPQAQDAVAHAKLAQLVSKHGSLEDAASAWFSGRPLTGNKRSDVNGTTVPGYVNSVAKNYASA